MKAKTPPPPKQEPPRQQSTDSPPNKSPIEQAIVFRDKLREMLGHANELIRSLKRQKQQQRLMQTTLASLRQLQATS